MCVTVCRTPAMFVGERDVCSVIGCVRYRASPVGASHCMHRHRRTLVAARRHMRWRSCLPQLRIMRRYWTMVLTGVPRAKATPTMAQANLAEMFTVSPDCVRPGDIVTVQWRMPTFTNQDAMFVPAQGVTWLGIVYVCGWFDCGCACSVVTPQDGWTLVLLAISTGDASEGSVTFAAPGCLGPLSVTYVVGCRPEARYLVRVTVVPS